MSNDRFRSGVGYKRTVYTIPYQKYKDFPTFFCFSSFLCTIPPCFEFINDKLGNVIFKRRGLDTITTITTSHFRLHPVQTLSSDPLLVVPYVSSNRRQKLHYPSVPSRISPLPVRDRKQNLFRETVLYIFSTAGPPCLWLVLRAGFRLVYPHCLKSRRTLFQNLK